MHNIFLFSFFISISLFSQDTKSSKYISDFKDIAMQEMYNYNIPASITLSQSIIESSFGESDLAVNGNNFFGIKCHNWQGFYHEKRKRKSKKNIFYHKSKKILFRNRFEIYFDDDKEDECFRKFNERFNG